MDEKVTREQMEEEYRERVRPGLETLIMNELEDLPRRFQHLRALHEALDGLKEMMEPCSCGRPDCMAAPQHRDLYAVRLAAAVEQLEAATEEIVQACIDMDWAVTNCSCEACQMTARRENAEFN